MAERAITPEEKLELRERIVSEAAFLYAEVGYTNFTMRRLAARLGYTATAIYRYFHNREDLILAMVGDGYALFRKYLMVDVVVSNDAVVSFSPHTRLKCVGEGYLKFAFEHPEMYKLMFMARPRALYDTAEEKVRDRMQMRLSVAGLISETVFFEEFTPDIHLEAADIFWATLHGLASLALSVPNFDEAWARKNFHFYMDTLQPALKAGRLSSGAKKRAAVKR
jgi:AcrR family transcriptional regulator